MCQPMAHRHAYYKYIAIAVILAASLEFPRFFEMKLEDGNGTWGKLYFISDYIIQGISHWNVKIFLKFSHFLGDTSIYKLEIEHKYIFQKKAAKLKRSPTWLDVYLVNVKSSGRLFQIFVAISECPNFSEA